MRNGKDLDMWPFCSKRRAHDIGALLLTQIAPGDSLLKMWDLVHNAQESCKQRMVSEVEVDEPEGEESFESFSLRSSSSSTTEKEGKLLTLDSPPDHKSEVLYQVNIVLMSNLASHHL
jgi:hypothetical protein